MAALGSALRGGWFPEQWDIPVALGVGVVITGYMGDTIAGWISQFVPAEWLNPASEFIIGIIMFLLGGWLTGDMSMWIRLFSFGAFGVAIADTITVVLGMTKPAATVVRTATPGATSSARSSSSAVVRGTY
jgi:hypothetical protein